MKMKMSIDKNAIQEFFLTNAEKVVFGGVIVCFMWMAYAAARQETFKDKPAVLVTSAANAKTHVEQTPHEDIRLVVPDYLSIARRSRIPIEEKFYGHTVIWRQPLSERPPPLHLPELFTVQELRPHVDRGPVAEGGAGARGGPAGTTGKTRGQRWVVLTGWVPLRKEIDAFKQAFQGAEAAPPQGDTPVYRYAYLERAEVTGKKMPKDSDWTALDFSDALKKAQLWGPGPVDPIDSRLTLPTLVFPLPPLNGRRFGAEIHHPKLVGPSYDLVRQDPEAYKGQKVTWSGESLQTAGTQVVYTRKGGGFEAPGTEEYFAVEYSTPEAVQQHQQGRAGMVTGTVAGKVVVSVPVRPRGGGTGTRTEFKSMPLLKAEGGDVVGGGGVEGVVDPTRGDPTLAPPAPSEPRPIRRAGEGSTAEQPEYLLFRFFDFAVQPGREYRYRVRLLLDNPTYKMDPRYLESADMAKNQWLPTRWSDPSEAVSVPRDVHLLALGVSAPIRVTGEPSGRVKIVKWVESNGLDAHEEFSCNRGSVLDFPDRKFDPAGRRRAARTAGGTGGLGGGTATATASQAFPVDYITGAVVLDMRGGERIAGRDRNVTQPGEILVLDAEGTLQVRSELADLSEAERLEAATEEGSGGTEPGGTAPAVPRDFEGGLERDDFRTRER